MRWVTLSRTRYGVPALSFVSHIAEKADFTRCPLVTPDGFPRTVGRVEDSGREIFSETSPTLGSQLSPWATGPGWSVGGRGWLENPHGVYEHSKVVEEQYVFPIPKAPSTF